MLARFRADPRRVRIGVRRSNGGWVGGGDRAWDVTITSRGSGMVVTRRDRSPLKALVKALRCAEESGMPGIDLGMQWAYNHPQKPE